MSIQDGQNLAPGLWTYAEISAWRKAKKSSNRPLTADEVATFHSPLAQVSPTGPVRPTGLENQTNVISVLTLIFGILGAGVVPIVLGHIAVSQINRTSERGHGMAIAGLILGYVTVVLSIILFVVFATAASNRFGV